MVEVAMGLNTSWLTRTGASVVRSTTPSPSTG